MALFTSLSLCRRICASPLNSIFVNNYLTLPYVESNWQNTIKHYSVLNFPCSIVLQNKNILGKFNDNNNTASIRHKSKKKSKNEEELEESDSDEDSVINLEKGKNFRDIKIKIASLRMDTILKAGLGVSRSEVEKLFYGSKLRINLNKVKKKSQSLHEGDKVDIVKGTPVDFPGAEVEVARVILVKIVDYDDKSEKAEVILRKYPQLLFFDYDKEEEFIV